MLSYLTAFGGGEGVPGSNRTCDCDCLGLVAPGAHAIDTGMLWSGVQRGRSPLAPSIDTHTV